MTNKEKKNEMWKMALKIRKYCETQTDEDGGCSEKCVFYKERYGCRIMDGGPSEWNIFSGVEFE